MNQTEPTPYVPMISDEVVLIYLTICYGFLQLSLCIFGSAVNVVNMTIFARLGFTETINLSLFSLAFSDFGACFMLIWMDICNLQWMENLDLPFHRHEIYFLISGWPHTFFTRITALVTCLIIAERCVCVTAPLKVKNIFTRRRITILIAFAYGLIILSAVPIYYSKKYAPTFYPYLNKTLVGLVITDESVQIDQVVVPLLNALFAFVPFVFIAVTTAILVASLRRKAEWRKAATAGSNPSVTNRKEISAAKMVVAISALFISCNFLNTILNPLMHTIDDLDINKGRERNLIHVLGSTSFNMEVVNSSMNIFIYYRSSTNYRDMFNKMFRRGDGKKRSGDGPLERRD